jgi:serine/threonine protein kinase
MGEVYRARDTRLGRTVAVKVLSASFAADADRRMRFEREARAIASLNHPHICTLHDIGQQDGLGFLVMEYVEGESLAQRLLRGPLPLDELLRHGIEIARALQRAHRQGIVHRDLKPGNVMLTRSGIKLLDFGLAKLTSSQVVETDTLSARLAALEPLTREGTYLGTLPYMAPEQLEGKDADSRSDIWSLGTVLYEMAAGKRAFAATSQAAIVGAIISKQPASLASVQPLAPAALERAVHTCLAKDPDERWQDAGDVARELQWIRDGGSHSVRPPRAGRKWRTPTALALATVTVAFGLGAWALMAKGRLRVGPATAVPRFVTLTMRHGIVASARFAPDGQSIVYTASWEGAPYELFLMRQGALEARPLGLKGRLLGISTQGDMASCAGSRTCTAASGC